MKRISLSLVRTTAWLPVLLTAAALPMSAQAREMVVYDVRQGDTLFKLSDALRTGMRAIPTVARLNGIANPNLITTGSRLRIPRDLLKEVETRAKVESFNGQVSLQVGGRAIAPGIGTELGESTMITTGRNSFVTLRLNDGSAISVPSQSSVRIIRLRRVVLTGAVERDFGLESGRTRARVTPMDNSGSTFRVRTPVNHAAVRGTVFRSAFDATSGLASTEVDEGKVGVGPDGKKDGLLVETGFGVAMNKSFSSGVVQLLPPPVLDNPGRVQSAPDLQFSMSAVPGAKSYRIEIGRDVSLLDGVAEDRSDTPSFTLPGLPSGSYFARVSAIDTQGLEGTAKTYAFRRRLNDVKGDLSQSGSQYLFKWLAEADSSPQYRFQLRRVNATDAPVVDELGLSEKSITISDLPPGEYAWRVLSTVAVNGELVESWSPEEKFEVAADK